MLSSRIPSRVNRAHVEDLKDPDEILLPSRDLILVVLGEDESEDRPPFTPFCDPPLNLRQGPTIERSVNGLLGVFRCSGSRSQGPNRTEDGLVQFIRPSPLQSLVERLAYFTASLPNFNVILIVGHRVLDHCEEDTGGTEGDLGWRNAAGVLGDV